MKNKWVILSATLLTVAIIASSVYFNGHYEIVNKVSKTEAPSPAPAVVTSRQFGAESYTPNSFDGISVESKKNDVKFLKGNPNKILNRDTWIYTANEPSAFEKSKQYYGFKGDKLHFILHTEDCFYGPNKIKKFKGITIDDSIATVKQQLGIPKKEIEVNDGLARVYYYKDGTLFLLMQAKVYGFGIYNKTFPLPIMKNIVSDINIKSKLQ